MMNANERVYAYNEISGEVALVPKRFLTHPVLGKNIREVRNGKRRIRLGDVAPVLAPEPIIQSEEVVGEDAPSEDSLEGKDD